MRRLSPSSRRPDEIDDELHQLDWPALLYKWPPPEIVACGCPLAPGTGHRFDELDGAAR
jgi:hypothetical protein